MLASISIYRILSFLVVGLFPNKIETCLINWIVAIPSWLSLSTHEGLEICVGLGACRGGEVGEVGHQVVLVERPPDKNIIISPIIRYLVGSSHGQ